MSQIRDDQKKQEREFQRALWDFRKQYYNPEKAPEFWDALIEAAEGLHKQFDASRNPYFREMIMACVVDIGRRSRE